MTPLDLVFQYHERTKHHLDRHARALGYMDWANQPDPFRTFEGSDKLKLDLPASAATPTYDQLFTGEIAAQPVDRASVSRLFHDALGLSAWKQIAGGRPWALRMNPSSGNLHPTEGYLLAGVVPGLSEEPGLLHYQPFLHAFERRAHVSPELWNELTRELPEPCLLVGLTSIHWREVWKYGERGFRYCQHDVGHAIGALTLAARMLGWETRLLDGLAHDELALLLGTHTQNGIEAEHPDCLLLVLPAPLMPHAPASGVPLQRSAFANIKPIGTPNALSRDHHDWPIIAEVAEATRWPGQTDTPEPIAPVANVFSLPERGCSAGQIIHQRRSAVDMDGRTSISRDAFYHMLGRVMPGRFPFDTLPWQPSVALGIFVHRVLDLEPGLYLLVRDPRQRASLASSLRDNFEWSRPIGCPRGLDLYVLDRDDARRPSKIVSCHQDIAADGAFSLGMLAEFEPALRRLGPGSYPRLFWETGLIGQVFYLEAEAAGIRATGIGCFFDDVMHDMLGITDRNWQSLYHFTVGGPVDDPRLQTIPAYAHLK